MSLHRRLSLLQATAINMIDMVGIGPFVTLPLVIGYFHSPYYIWAWVLGAGIALLDGCIWSELGAAYPLAGGTYNFHKVAYPGRAGRLMSFLFVWQTSIQAPLVVASGALGFVKYVQYFAPLGFYGQKGVAIGLIAVIGLLLYRRIDSIGRLSVALWVGVLGTIGWIIIGGFTHATVPVTLFPTGGGDFLSGAFWTALGAASVKTIYSFLGYYNVCHLGGEIRNPGRNIPRSIFLSIAGISLLYLCLNWAVAYVVPWQEAQHYDFIASIAVERMYGPGAGRVATGLVLWIAFASLFAVVLGYSRVPYAAAADGAFFPAFARLHPTKDFPYVSLLFILGLAVVFTFFLSLKETISAILAMRILVQFVAQGVGVLLLRRRRGTRDLPWKMPLYPLPVIVSVAIWGFVLWSTGEFALWGIGIAALGVLVFGLTEKWMRGRGETIALREAHPPQTHPPGLLP
ncbi:APC family permease [Flaviaesturariibacter aridisoli]|uniref:APC family permease n=1 Tax=Flaviaesturariibacter aridisoli TaxID=2545761 RepID=A0A4R4E9S0_9BACT|nr:APC family permease [Flaviaesturariibacter aridisoli]TCZ74598.1 APC family permease [Flaviaesturariibacter aridisoli]